MGFRDLHEIEAMFRDFEATERAEVALAACLEATLARLRAYDADPANKPARRLREARYKRRHRAECTARERRRLERMRVEEPERWRAILDRMNAAYHAKKLDPAWVERRRAKQREWMRRHRAAKKKGAA